ncbi:MAG TPA: aminodeoxychorismate/anthranilate synthase component II [Defluviitaleaceae bacterium]|nr:aminodeoxychorismate/anthranilate synthase component II [Defluviitaleaceae bacterium]HPT77070.1 aminodeoxychorismate/anthranilate synthase component II [Defluviitaleaceae bacterium]HQD51454.1 aminodeoxychorismate/anthranilate synthase component II [Defluviitaleaceae bacterium]
MVLLIDNYDSFTYNLYQYIGAYKKEIKVVRNDEITIEEIEKMNPSHIVISSGPGTPQKAGLCMDIIKNFYKKIPILGVGLGHQCIGLAFGAKLIQSKKLSHGKTSIVMHKGMNIFEEIKNPMRVGRYHSLVLDMDTISDCFEIAAITEDKEVMAIFHKEYPLVGVQFNPESINTPEGQKIIENFLKKELILC